MNNAVCVSDANQISNEDFGKVLEETVKLSWDDFNKKRKEEISNGKLGCPEASLIALVLLEPALRNSKYSSTRTDSEAFQDLKQDAYLKITEHIRDYDEAVSTFPTFMRSYISELARDSRNGGKGDLSEYQLKKKGFRVVSKDAIIAKGEADGQVSEFEIVDEFSSVEDVYEKQQLEHSSSVLKEMIEHVNKKVSNKIQNDEPGNITSKLKTEIEKDKANERRKLYINATYYHRFLGGHSNLPTGMSAIVERTSFADYDR